MNKSKGVHKALGRGGRARVIEITLKSKPSAPPKPRRKEVSK